MQQKMILHIDMDAFYASIEERDRSSLRGKPMVVGGNPHKRGVVAAANYAARQYGIHSTMPTAQALRRCPHLIVLPPRHSYYAQVSQHIRDIFHRYTPLVEPLSLDEAFLDVTHSRRLFGEAADIGQRIKQDIRHELQLTASVGGAHNKFLAKVASDIGKPERATQNRGPPTPLSPRAFSPCWWCRWSTRRAFWDRWWCCAETPANFRRT